MADAGKTEWDTIVIGSGMGGMTAAAALSKFGHKVLLLEQHQTLGGLTHSFSRDGFNTKTGRVAKGEKFFRRSKSSFRIDSQNIWFMIVI